MTREEYFDALKAFDWYYEMSDSSEVYTRGASQMVQIRAEAEADHAKKQMFEAFCGYYNDSRPTKPTREEFDL